MARTQTTEVTTNDIDAIMAALRTPSNGLTLMQRLENAAVDTVADSSAFISRIAAGASSAVETFGDAYAIERERQLRRRAERILRASQH